jgi:phenylacetic acid degradation operon negative regulatory protein
MNSRSMLFTIYGEYVRHYGGEIWVGSLTRIMGEFGLTEQAVRAAISRVLRQGWIQSRKIGNRSYYSMTEKGKKRLDEAAARIYKQNPEQWDGKWTMVSYNIPEKIREKRDQLRKELTWLGFGMLNTSTWISPHNLGERVKEISQSYEVEDFVEIFNCDHLGWSSEKDLVKKCWDLDGIQNAYQEFIDKYQPKLEEFIKKGPEGYTDGECFVEKTYLVHEYRKFLFIDPDIPEALLPERWNAKIADVLFKEYYDLLNPGAIRFFESIFEPAPEPV